MATFHISSTFEDLKEYRNAAVRALADLQASHKVLNTGGFPSTNPEDVAWAFQELERCDACIFIIGFRYGSIPAGSDSGLSAIEMEYRRARELKKPTFVFVADEKANWPAQFIDSNPQRIEAFRAFIRRDVQVMTFKSPEDFIDLLRRVVGEWAIKFSESTLLNGASDPVQSAAPATAPADQWPPDVDLRVLAWHLVADFKSGPDLLRHMDIELLRQAIDKWELENNADTSASWSERVTTANAQLLSKHQGWAPNKLWLAWMEPPRIPVPTASPSPKTDAAAINASMSRANQA